MMVKFEIDVAFDDDEESFVDVLARMGAELPEAFVRIVNIDGIGSGWPVIEVVIQEELIGKFVKWYSGGEEDAEYAAWLAEGAVPAEVQR